MLLKLSVIPLLYPNPSITFLLDANPFGGVNTERQGDPYQV
jgi:hypothetical protein